jgi:two-component system, NtrC family, sensor histidine kinase HydH
MNRKTTPIAITGLGGAILLVSTLHFFTPIDDLVFHQIYQRLYYIPIILAALWYGWRGGLGAASLASISYIPHIALHWQHQNYDYALNQYAEITLFFVIGAVTGWLGDQKRREHERAERINVELQTAYGELRTTVGQLLQAERLSSLAEIASGVVHEVRNPLGAIKGAVEILEDEIAENSPRREFARIAKVEIERINKLVTEFVRIARPPVLTKTPTKVNELVESVVVLLEHQAATHNIAIKSELAADIPTIGLDREQIEQVLINLAINAFDAMPVGGTVIFRTSHNENETTIEVEDTGGGIPVDTLERIFDPFFTTKEKGTGLGLSIAHKIVSQHGGKLLAENTDRGALLRLIINKPDLTVPTRRAS